MASFHPAISATALPHSPMMRPCSRNSFNIALAVRLTSKVIHLEISSSQRWQISPAVLKMRWPNLAVCFRSMGGCFPPPCMMSNWLPAWKCRIRRTRSAWKGRARFPTMAGRVRRVWLEPDDAPAFPPVIKAILNADVIVVGPGSLYTSLLPNLLVHDLLAAMHVSRAIKIYVCNIATQSGETDSYHLLRPCPCAWKNISVKTCSILFYATTIISNDIDPSSQWVRADEKILSDPVLIAPTSWMMGIPGGMTRSNSRRSSWIFFMNAPVH